MRALSKEIATKSKINTIENLFMSSNSLPLAPLRWSFAQFRMFLQGAEFSLKDFSILVLSENGEFKQLCRWPQIAAKFSFNWKCFNFHHLNDELHGFHASQKSTSRTQQAISLLKDHFLHLLLIFIFSWFNSNHQVSNLRISSSFSWIFWPIRFIVRNYMLSWKKTLKEKGYLAFCCSQKFLGKCFWLFYELRFSVKSSLTVK